MYREQSTDLMLHAKAAQSLSFSDVAGRVGRFEA